MKTTLLEIELVREVRTMAGYRVYYMGKEIKLTVVKGENGNVTYNWSEELPDLVCDFVEAWLEEKI